MLGVEFTQSAHTGCYSALPLCLPVTGLSTRSLRVRTECLLARINLILRSLLTFLSDTRFSRNVETRFASIEVSEISLKTNTPLSWKYLSDETLNSFAC